MGRVRMQSAEILQRACDVALPETERLTILPQRFTRPGV